MQSSGGWSKNDPDNPKAIYSLTKAAGEFMEKNKDRPFLVYLPHYAIHTKLDARKSTLAHFEAKTPGKQHHDPLYAACTYDLDDGIGILTTNEQIRSCDDEEVSGADRRGDVPTRRGS